ncbi:MAG TPA: hypothetical protein VGE01_08425 [Fimbriimonas sp.]
MEKTIPATAAGGSFNSMLQAFELLGLTHLIGEAGEYTAFTTGDEDILTYHIIPGKFSSDEFQDMLSLLMVAPVTDRASVTQWEVDEAEFLAAA